MTVAMFWYMIRNRHYSALRVAIFAGLGGGFGFAFGDFLQALGIASEIKFNFWNVMEYSIGFFGGIGMAYGAFTAEWEESKETTDKSKLLAPIIILTFLIPFVVWDQSFTMERLMKTVQEISPESDAPAISHYVQWVALLLPLLFLAGALYRFYISQKSPEYSLDFGSLKQFFFANLGIYTASSLLMTCAFMSLYRIEQYLYVVNVVVIYFLMGRYQPTFSNRGINVGRWAINLLFILAVIALLTAVAVSSHGELKSARVRFE
jgi:hypothetical protein